MNHARTKLIVAGLALALAVGYLAFAGVRKGWVYYVDVDTYFADEKYQSQRVRLAGKVAEENCDSRPGLMTANFELRGENRTLPVSYQGVVPDAFTPGCEVVVEGRTDEAGVFQADMMMTKCASKYEGEDHAQRLENVQ